MSLDPGTYGYFLRGSKPRKQLRADYALRLERSDGMERELSIDMEEDGESYPRCSMGLEYIFQSHGASGYGCLYSPKGTWHLKSQR